MLWQQLANGITLGSIYALIALGYTMIFGVLLLINFAQGEVFMVGAFVGVLVATTAVGSALLHSHPHGGLLLLFLAAMAGCALLGVLIERIALRPLRFSPRIAALITSLGISIVLQNAVMLRIGSSNQVFPALFPSGHFLIGNTTISYLQLFIMVVSIALMLVLHFFVSQTTFGMAIRAARDDKEVARLMGIRVNSTVSLTFAIAGLLAGAAGILYGMYYGVAKFDMGYLPGIKAFTAAIFGGVGNLYGAMLGGLVIGLVETMTAGYISADYKDVFVFVILILVLLFRPTGILGEEIARK